jgi:3-hydroxyisobutyrate dehydrogenase-like beta-hydroxyacid dehydrogenase
LKARSSPRSPACRHAETPSRVLHTRFPLAGADPAHPSSRAWATLFALDLSAKDLQLAAELARADGVEPALAEEALAAYRRAQAAGHGALDYSAVFLAERATRAARVG